MPCHAMLCYQAVAAAHNKSAAQVALRWVVQQGVVAVTASAKAEHSIAWHSIAQHSIAWHSIA